MDNGTYRSTGVFQERKKSSGSCVPTNSRASSRRFSISGRCSFGRTCTRVSIPATNCSRLTTLAQFSITLESCSRLSLMDSATRRRSSSCRQRSYCSSHSFRRISASRSASFTFSTTTSVELWIDFAIFGISVVRARSLLSWNNIDQETPEYGA